MNAPEEQDLPQRLQHALHGMVPDAPAGLSPAERAMLARVGEELGRGGGVRWARWMAGVAAAAGLLVVVAALQFRTDEGASMAQLPSPQQTPTIVDVLRAAQAGRPQAELDRLAMAAVRVDGVQGGYQ